MEPDIFAEVETQIGRLGLPNGFYRSLLDEDDWSFVIKLNALIEACCSDALASCFHRPEIAACLASLELGHKKHGKVALLVATKAIAKDQAQVLQALYELRNKLAHNVSQVSFTFSKYLDDLEESDVRVFLRNAGYGILHGPDGEAPDVFVRANPKLALWISVAEIIACLHLEHAMSSIRIEKIALDRLRDLP